MYTIKARGAKLIYYPDIFEVVKVFDEHTGIIEETGLERCIIHIHLAERDLCDVVWHDMRPIGFTEENYINDFPIHDRKVVSMPATVILIP